MLNNVCIMGRLARDPELRYTPNGVAVCNLTLAVERNYKNSDGKKEADFIDVQAWESTAEFAAKYFAKGRAAVVSGRLQTRTYTDKQNIKRKVCEVVASSIYFADSKKDDGGAAAQTADFGQEIEFDQNELPF